MKAFYQFTEINKIWYNDYVFDDVILKKNILNNLVNFKFK